MWHVRRIVLISVAAMVLAIPVVTADEDLPISKPSALIGSSLAWCPEVHDVEADPTLFRDRPIYVGNAPTLKLQRWAEQR